MLVVHVAAAAAAAAVSVLEGINESEDAVYVCGTCCCSFNMCVRWEMYV